MTPLVIAFTPNYFVPAATMLRSVLDSSPAQACYEVICLVSEDIPQRQRDKLARMAGDRMVFEYVNLAGRMQDVYVDSRYTEAASYRLLLPELLPDHDKVIYIDCDVIVRNDLSQVYDNTDLGRFLLAAVYEAPIENQSERWAALGCNPDGYFNSGFLIMNLARMREDGTSAKLMEALKVDYLEFPDQDALNQVCQGQVFPLPPVYNSIRTFFLPQYKDAFLKHYLPEDWDEVQKHGTIHYTGGKPWDLLTVQFGEWWDVYRTLPVAVKEEWQPSARVRALAALYQTSIGRFAVERLRGFVRKIRK